MSLFASLGAATLEYSTRERRAALRRPLNLWDSHSLSGSSEGCLSPQHRGQSSSDRASSEDGDEVPSRPSKQSVSRYPSSSVVGAACVPATSPSSAEQVQEEVEASPDEKRGIAVDGFDDEL